jgi:HEAT repeat protein
MQSNPSVSSPSEPSRVAELVAQMPKPDPDSGILSNVDDEAVRKAVAELLRGGKQSVAALVDMLVEPGQGKSDSQARHALHAMVMHAGGLGDEQRRSLAAALGATLAGEGKPASARSFVVRQLQLCGGAEAAAAIGPLLLDENVYADAAMALQTIREGAAAQFRAALPKATGKQRVAVVHGLGTLRDAKSADAVRKLASDPDRDTRLTALWALASAGDAASADVLTKAADDAPPGFERTRASSACLLLAERLAVAGRKDEAGKIYRHLRDTRTDPSERYVRDAADRALAG